MLSDTIHVLTVNMGYGVVLYLESIVGWSICDNNTALHSMLILYITVYYSFVLFCFVVCCFFILGVKRILKLDKLC